MTIAPGTKSKTSVVNCKVANIRPAYATLAEWVADPKNEYIGRRGVVFVRGERFPKKDSPFHNPFKISKGVGRAQVVAHFEAYLRKRLAEEPELVEKLMSLKGKNLGCWCAPEACHGHVLVKLIDELEAKREATNQLEDDKKDLCGKTT